jgi:hypothetical protein
MECLPLWPTYGDEKERTLGKIYAIQWGAIGNNLGEHIGNLGHEALYKLVSASRVLDSNSGSFFLKKYTVKHFIGDIMDVFSLSVALRCMELTTMMLSMECFSLRKTLFKLILNSKI